MKTDRILSIARIAALVIICVACLVPFYVLLVLALNSPGRIFYEGNMFVPDFHFSNFIEAWEESRIGQAMVNSAIITAGTLARRRTRFNGFVFGLLLSCMMIPGIINTVPLYTLMRRLHAVNTLYGMVLVCSTLALPSAVFIYSTFIASLPRELDEAAVLDGCTGFSVFWRIIFPVMKPATASFVILNGFGIWNNYSQSVFFLQSRSKQNIPQALSVFFQQFGGADWNMMAATATIAIVPVVVVFLVFQRQFISGLASGAVKG